MTKSISILPLADCVDLIDTLAYWTFSEWGRFDASNSLEKTKERLHNRLNKQAPPICFVGFHNKLPVGCVSVKLNDMPDRYPDAEYWIGSMFVLSEHRGQGVGSCLMSYVITNKAVLGIDDLYLWTGTAEKFYAKHGFVPLERLRHLDQDIVVMKRNKEL